MFDISFGELGLILLVSLVVLGPKKATEAARTVGQWMGKIKKMANNFQNEINSYTTPIKDEIEKIKTIEEQIHSSVMDTHDNYKILFPTKVKKPFRRKKITTLKKRTLKKNIKIKSN